MLFYQFNLDYTYMHVLLPVKHILYNYFACLINVFVHYLTCYTIAFMLLLSKPILAFKSVNKNSHLYTFWSIFLLIKTNKDLKVIYNVKYTSILN